MTSEREQSQQLDSTPASPIESTDSGIPRRNLFKGATVAAAAASALVGGLTLPAHMASAQTRTSTVNSLPSNKKPSSFKYSLEQAAPQVFAGGTNRDATAANIEELSGLAMSSVHINPGGMHELHWHMNASELSFCLSGQGEVGIFLSGQQNAIFPIQPGSTTFVPVGATHYIRNTGSDVLHVIETFSNENPEHIDFSEGLGLIPRNLLAQTFGLQTQDFPAIPAQGDQFLVKTGQVPANTSTLVGGPFTVNVNDIAPVLSPGGFVNNITPQLIPGLDQISLVHLQAQPGGMREPHWHPNSSELNYCVQGTAQIEIITPDHTHEVFQVQPGDIAFVPQNYFHYISSTSADPLIFLVFFANKAPSHIDLSQVMGFFPRELFAASFGSNLHIFDTIPNVGDVVIAAKVV
jgi:oxalate decarboxylase